MPHTECHGGRLLQRSCFNLCVIWIVSKWKHVNLLQFDAPHLQEINNKYINIIEKETSINELMSIDFSSW